MMNEKEVNKSSLRQKSDHLQPAQLFSIVMPAYNEDDVIEKTLIDLISHLDKSDFQYEIVVINDGSTDQTEAILTKISALYDVIKHINNDGPGGYGHAIRKGLDVYQGDAVVIVTSDGSDSPKDIVRYFEKIQEGYECAFGSRFMPGARVTGYPKFKLLVNRTANHFLSWLLKSQYKDFTNGFKCYRRHVIDDIQPLITGQFNITIELSVSATLSGWNYAVVPTDWIQRDAGDSSFYMNKLFKPYFLTLIYCMTRSYLKKIKR